MSIRIIELKESFEDFFADMKIESHLSDDKYPVYLQAMPCGEKDGFHFELIQRRKEDDIFGSSAFLVESFSQATQQAACPACRS